MHFLTFPDEPRWHHTHTLATHAWPLLGPTRGIEWAWLSAVPSRLHRPLTVHLITRLVRKTTFRDARCQTWAVSDHMLLPGCAMRLCLQPPGTRILKQTSHTTHYNPGRPIWQNVVLLHRRFLAATGLVVARCLTLLQSLLHTPSPRHCCLMHACRGALCLVPFPSSLRLFVLFFLYSVSSIYYFDLSAFVVILLDLGYLFGGLFAIGESTLALTLLHKNDDWDEESKEWLNGVFCGLDFLYAPIGIHIIHAGVVLTLDETDDSFDSTTRHLLILALLNGQRRPGAAVPPLLNSTTHSSST